MRPELADLVLPIIFQGLGLRDRLLANAPLVLETEQAALITLLQTDRESLRVPDFGGDPRSSTILRSTAEVSMGRAGERYLGARYALVCWLDELFILNSPWDRRWNERKLEVSLYSTNDRAWRFWDQARLASMRPTTDALEVFYLCVMLGFRGELGERADQLNSWVASTRAQLVTAHPPKWPAPAELDAATQVPPRHGQERMQHMLLALGAACLALLPLLSFTLVRQLTR